MPREQVRQQPTGAPPAARGNGVPALRRDVRAKRPPALSFLLRWETARRAARVASLLALDFAAVYLAILTALLIKMAVRDKWDPQLALDQTDQYVSFAFLVTALLFARSGLYAGRAERPGLTRIVSSLTAVTVVALLYAVVNGQEFSSYYIFYGSLFFGVAFVASFRYLYERITGAVLHAAGYHRTAVLVGTGHHIEAVANALSTGDSPVIKVVGFVSLQPRPDNGVPSLGTLDQIERVVDDHRVDEVIIADPGFPAPGTRFHHRVGFGPINVEDHTLVMESAPPHRLVLRARARPLGTAKVTMDIQPEGGGSRVTMIEAPADPLTKLVFNPLTHLLVRGRNTESLRRLQELAERPR